MNLTRRILPVIVIAQFFCTSLWFAGNAVMDELIHNYLLNESALSYLTSSVQLGFISGTLVFALFSFADRYSPSKVFLVCASIGAIFNLGMVWDFNSYFSLILFRFLTGFSLAGIYPVGMKIASDYYDKGLGKSLGFLVAALVLGTAIPHLLKDLKGEWPWQSVLIGTSTLSLTGGILMYFFVPDGPFRKSRTELNLMASWNIFRNRQFRSAAFGYFGHMWELYAFWAFVPVVLQMYNHAHPDNPFDVALSSFFIIGIGGLSCIAGGYIAHKAGDRKTAFIVLLISCCLCLLSPVLLNIDNKAIFFGYLLLWGVFVIPDSPLFSTLVAINAPAEYKGTALTIVTCLGFFITIISIQLIDLLLGVEYSDYILIVLALGPILGLLSLFRNFQLDKSGFNKYSP